jgi:hypothetical protein
VGGLFLFEEWLHGVDHIDHLVGLLWTGNIESVGSSTLAEGSFERFGAVRI